MRDLHLKTTLIFLVLTINGFTTFSQSFNDDKITFGNFLKRMFTATPFEGIKIVDDYNQSYLVSVITLDKSKYTSMSVMNRVAQVKAQSQANTFINGSSISSDLIIKTSEKKSNNSVESITEILESIKVNSYGFTRGLELLTNFDNQDGTRMVFIYFRALSSVK
jgi:hypothetical protein